MKYHASQNHTECSAGPDLHSLRRLAASFGSGSFAHSRLLSQALPQFRPQGPLEFEGKKLQSRYNLSHPKTIPKKANTRMLRPPSYALDPLFHHRPFPFSPTSSPSPSFLPSSPYLSSSEPASTPSTPEPTVGSPASSGCKRADRSLGRYFDGCEMRKK